MLIRKCSIFLHATFYTLNVVRHLEKRNLVNPKIFEPVSELEDFVKCYWTLESSLENTPTRNTIVPDGTVKLIFHYGDLYWHHPKSGKSFLQPRCFLIGQLTKPYIVEPAGETGTFVIRFNPNGFSPFTNIPIKEMENKPIALKELFGEKGKKLEQEILDAKNTSQRINIAEKFLLELLKSKEVKDRIVNSTIETIVKYKGQLSVNELSNQASLSRRILARKFSSNVGLSPKQLSKIVRLQATLKSLLQNEKTNLTDLTYENEYFDQSHFIKDFKEFTGITPKEFYGEDLKMSLIFDSKK